MTRPARTAVAVLLLGACHRQEGEALALFDVSVAPQLAIPFQTFRFSVVDRPALPVRTVPREAHPGDFLLGYYLAGVTGSIVVEGQAVTDGGCVVGAGRAAAVVAPGKTSPATALVIAPIVGAGPGCQLPGGSPDAAAPGDGDSGDGPAARTDAPSVEVAADAGNSPTPADAPSEGPVTPSGMGGAGGGGGAPDGTPCASASACISGRCVDGVCCESACDKPCEACAEPGNAGRCVAVGGAPRGARPGCGGQAGPCAGACDGTKREGCSFPGMDRECAPATCQAGSATPRSVCDAKGACPAQTPVVCAPFACSGTGCAGGCSPTQPCAADSYCSVGKCLPKQAAGAPCTGSDACASGICVDGLCCDRACSGACESCNLIGSAGHCSSVKSADDDGCAGKICDASGACKSRSGSDCASGGECASGSCVDGKCCTSAACGSCQRCTGGGGTCVAVTSADDVDSCPGTCDAAGSCKSKLGQSCTAGGGCASGTSCSPDGVCCDQPCLGTCMACDLPGLAGICSPVSSGAPHGNRASCGGTGPCAGACSAGQCAFPGGSCGAASCSGNSLTGPGTCANGMCMTPAAQPCPGDLVCAGSACKTSCTSDADCTPSHFCAGGSCHLAAAKIYVGAFFSCAVLTDGTTRCWGANDQGQFGNGGTADSAKPVAAATLGGTPTAIGGRFDGVCELVSGSVKCWGENQLGQVGSGAPTDATAPKAVSGLTSPIAVASGGRHGCAVLADGTGMCWGSGFGTGSTSNNNLPPTTVAGLKDAVAITAGYEHTCVILNWGVAQCWGWSDWGETGEGTLGGAVTMPKTVANISNVRAIAASRNHTCAVLTNSTVYCWGLNGTEKRLGAETANPWQPYPVKVGSLTAATALALGETHTCALLSTGAVVCWGNNRDKQLGTAAGAVTESVTPVTIAGVSGATSIAAGSAHTCALEPNGVVKCWGKNDRGQLGDNTTTTNPTPVVVVW